MGCNIPRPWKRPPTPKIEGSIVKYDGFLTPNEIRKQKGLLPIEEPFYKEKKIGPPVLYKCINCGASLIQKDSIYLCEYCGTRYGYDPGGEEVAVDNFYSDGKLVYQEFSKVAHDIGIEAPNGTTIQLR